MMDSGAPTRTRNLDEQLNQFLRVESHDDYCLSTHDDTSMCTKCVHDDWCSVTVRIAP
jgi:hypothetical protein